MSYKNWIGCSRAKEEKRHQDAKRRWAEADQVDQRERVRERESEREAEERERERERGAEDSPCHDH